MKKEKIVKLKKTKGSRYEIKYYQMAYLILLNASVG